MSRSDLSDLLERYARRETSPEEDIRVEEWLAKHPEHESSWDRMSETGRKQWLDRLWTDIETSTNAPGKIIPLPARRIRWAAIASVAAILLVSIGFWWFNQSASITIAPSGFSTISTKAAEKKSVLLADGSTVWLNAGSSLKYPGKFSDKTREVYLDGEAYFDIKHDEEKTFIVHTGKVLTTVLGTAFNIISGDHDSLVTVTVTRGKVKVSEGETLLGFLTPNQQISYNILNSEIKKSTVDAAVAISWKSDDLLFDDITFAEAAEIISKRFQVKIEFANDDIRNCRFTGTALSGKNPDEILKVICAFNNATATRNPDGSIIINGKGCK